MSTPKSLHYSHRCWNCGKEHDRVTGINGESEPTNGSLLFCIDCGAFSILDNTYPDGGRKPNPDENFNIRHDKQLQRVIAMWLISKEMRKR